MDFKRLVFIAIFCAAGGSALFAQTYISVPIDDDVYGIIENAQMRGLCKPLPFVKPYSRDVVLQTLDEILASENLGEGERRILENAKAKYGEPAKGFSFARGAYFTKNAEGSKVHLSADVGFKASSIFSNAYNFSANENDAGFDFLFGFYLAGDIGTHFSYKLDIAGDVVYAPRKTLGYVVNREWDEENGVWYDVPTSNKVETEPLAFFPYSFKRHFDGFVFAYNNVSSGGLLPWPQDSVSLGYMTTPEIAGAFLDGVVTYRMGRTYHEWGAAAEGSSLILNKSAHPFMGIELTIQPFYWLAFSSLTGVLEYYFTDKGMKASAMTEQNAFSILLVEFNYKNYLHLDAGSSSVWAKRFELGYLFPFIDNYLYQNNIGDFDNLSFFGGITLQYPRVGKLWFSLFLDEVDVSKIGKSPGLFELDRSMYAFQVGLKAPLPFLSFSSVEARLTKVEPFCYTHNRTEVPWYNQLMESAYTNNGEGIGYYLRPNSLELLTRFETMPETNTTLRCQYQLVIHGADWGSGAVEGSSFLSELGGNRDYNTKYFLHDGAYQWQHIIKAGASHSFKKAEHTPFEVFAEAGFVFSYFTNIEGDANTTKQPYKKIDTYEYPVSNTFVFAIGFKVFP